MYTSTWVLLKTSVTESANWFWKKGEMYLERIFQMKEGYKVSCVKICRCSYILRDWYLFEILHTWSTVKTGKNLVKSQSFRKLLRWRPQFFCWKEQAVWGVPQWKAFSVKIFWLLIYQEASIYLKYCKPHSLLKIVKMW